MKCYIVFAFFVLFNAAVKTDTKLTLHHIFYYLTYPDKI